MGTPILGGVFYKIIEIFKPTCRKRKAEGTAEETVSFFRTQLEDWAQDFDEISLTSICCNY